MIPSYIIKSLAITMIPMIPKIVTEAWNLISGLVTEDENTIPDKTVKDKEPKQNKNLVPHLDIENKEATSEEERNKNKTVLKPKRKHKRKDMHVFTFEERIHIRKAFIEYCNILTNDRYPYNITQKALVDILNQELDRDKCVTSYVRIWMDASIVIPEESELVSPF